MSEISWKPNWSETKRHFDDFWNRKGVVLGRWGVPRASTPTEKVEAVDCLDINEYYLNPVLRAKVNHYRLSFGHYGADVLPISNPDFGPGLLATFLGCEPGISERTVTGRRWTGQVIKRSAKVHVWQ